MSNYATLKAAISTAIKQNGNEEITGQVLQTTLLSMVDSLVSGYLFKGIATPSTVVGTPDENVFWIAPAGSYSNFGATPIDVPTGCIGIFQYNGSFTNTVVYVGGMVDISALSHTAYGSLSQALEDLPASLHIGGIEVQYQDSATGKFVSFRLMKTSWSTTVSDWQMYGEPYPEVNFICDADIYRYIPCSLQAGKWRVSLTNASMTSNVVADFKDTNGNPLFTTDEVPPQETKTFIIELDRDAASVGTAFVGTTLSISHLSSDDYLIFDNSERIKELEDVLTDETVFEQVAYVDAYIFFPCPLQAGKWKVTLHNASTTSPVTAAFKDANDNIFYATDEVRPQETKEFVVNLEIAAVSVATAFVGTTLNISTVSKITEIENEVEDIESRVQTIEEKVEPTITTTTKVVDANGTIGTDCDFNDIASALDSISDNGEKKRYLIFVKNGVYDITGINYLGFKNFVTVKGESRDGVVVSNSSVTYNSSVSCFDPQKYGDNIIDFARIENLTLKIKNGKCGVHIDGNSIKNGGTIEIDNCRFINETEEQYLYYLRGGVNCGLNGGQTVKITNCFGNVLCYAHTRINPSVALPQNNFIFKNCQFNFIAYYDVSDIVSDNKKNKLIVEDCKCDYIGIGISDIANDKTKCSIDYIIDNSTQFNWVYMFGQGTVPGYDSWFTKYPICSSIHQAVRNNTGSTISKGTFVSLSIIGGIPAADNLQPQYDYNIVPYDGNELYGVTLEDIAEGEVGIIQIKGKVLISNNNYAAGDYITLDNNGTPIIGTKANAIGIVTNPNQPYIGATLIRLITNNIVY